MRSLRIALSLAVFSTSLAAAQAPAQLPLQQPQLAHQHDADTLVRYTWERRAGAEAAARWMEDEGLDVWRTSSLSIDVRISSEQATTLFAVFSPSSDEDDRLLNLQANALPALLGPSLTKVLIPSISTHLDSPSVSTSFNLLHSNAAISNLTSTRFSSIDDTIHDSYHPYDGITMILQAMEAEFPGYAKMVSLGFSSEGREIWGLKVTNMSYVPGEQTADSQPGGAHVEKRKKKRRVDKKYGFVVAAAQHAREWIAPSTSLYLIHDLLLSVTSPDPEEQEQSTSSLLNELEFTFVPVVNVDGYAFTWESNRLWRKNRQDVGNECFGLDLNRNWGYRWSAGSRPNPCSDAFPGSKPFQAPELQALRSYLTHKSNNVVAFLDLHSFGQMIMFPFSYSCSDVSPDEENHFEGVVGAAKALRAVHGRSFEVGSVCDVSLTAPGESIDWTYAVAKVRWSFAVELRDSGVFGFLLPPSQIRPSGEEMSAALKSLADYVLRKEAGQRFDFGIEE